MIWTWSVDLMHARDGVVRAVDWTLTGTADGRSASRSGRAWLGEPGEDAIAIADLTDEHLLAWVRGRIAVDGVQAGILQELFPLHDADLYAVEEPTLTVPPALAGLVLANEPVAATRARLAGRWVELTHLLQMGLATGEQAAEHTLLSAHQEWLTS